MHLLLGLVLVLSHFLSSNETSHLILSDKSGRSNESENFFSQNKMTFCWSVLDLSPALLSADQIVCDIHYCLICSCQCSCQCLMCQTDFYYLLYEGIWQKVKYKSCVKRTTTMKYLMSSTFLLNKMVFSLDNS